MNFLTPLGLLAGALALPVILLYMLRLRRREVTVSSTYLWRQILQDNEANTPWQRLRRNLLLLLQLLILLLLALALARPFIIVPAVGAGQLVVLIDASASMNAADIDGETRFEEAQRRALEIVDTLGGGDRMTVIRVAGVAEVLASATNNQTLLRAAIERAQPGRESADWSAALTLAAGGAAGAEDFSAVVISDGGLGDPALLPRIPGEIRYVPIGVASSNVAITALATRELPGRDPQLFAQVTNYGDADAEIIFDLRVDGALFTAERYTVPAHGALPLVSEALPGDFQVLEAGLTLPAEATVPDYLTDDNSAWAIATGMGRRDALLMSPGNLFIEQVLRSLSEVESFRGDIERGLPSREFDLYILDSWLPDQLPDADLLILNPPASTPLFTVGGASTQTANPRIKRDDPRTAFLDFNDVDILRFVTISDAGWADSLVSVEGGPLLLAGEIDGQQVAIITFDIHESDLPLQIAWPVMMANLLEWFAPQHAITASGNLTVGDPLVIRPPFDADAVRVTLPDGDERTLAVERAPLIFAETRQPGIYRLDVLAGGEIIQSAPFAVNLFAPGESDITPRESITLGSEAIGETEREEVGQREFWPWLAVLGLAILLIEWVVYHRRLHVPTAGRMVLRRRQVG